MPTPLPMPVPTPRPASTSPPTLADLDAADAALVLSLAVVLFVDAVVGPLPGVGRLWPAPPAER